MISFPERQEMERERARERENQKVPHLLLQSSFGLWMSLPGIVPTLSSVFPQTKNSPCLILRFRSREEQNPHFLFETVSLCSLELIKISLSLLPVLGLKVCLVKAWDTGIVLGIGICWTLDIAVSLKHT